MCEEELKNEKDQIDFKIEFIVNLFEIKWKPCWVCFWFK